MKGLHTFACEYLGQFSTSYLIETGHYNVFIDTALRRNVPVLAQFAENGKKNVVLLTHGHWDHIGGNAYLKSKGAGIFANAADLPWLTDFRLHWDIGFEQFKDEVTVPPARWDTFWDEIGEIVLPDVLTEDGGELEFDDLRIKAVYLPGHSAGSTGWYIESEDILFTGDALMGKGFFGGLAQFCDREKYLESMRRIISLDPETVLTAHTEPYRSHTGAKEAGTAIEFADSIEEKLREYISVSDKLSIGDAARYVCGALERKAGCGSCITVMNRMKSLEDPKIARDIDFRKYHCGI